MSRVLNYSIVVAIIRRSTTQRSIFLLYNALSKLGKHLHRPTDRRHQPSQSLPKLILSGDGSAVTSETERELPSIVGGGGDDLPCSLSADNNSCTPLLSLSSFVSISCASRAVDHTYVLIMARNKRPFNSAMQFPSCGQQNQHICALSCRYLA